MDANKIIDYLLEKIKGIMKENAFLVAQLEATKEELERLKGEKRNDE